MIIKHKYYITFDLIQEYLKKYYSKKRTTAYYDIKKELDKQGFEHIQGSVYASKNNITHTQCSKKIDNIYKNLPWLYFCVKDLDITVVQPKIYNAHETICKKRTKEDLNKLEKQLIKKVKLSK